MVTGRVQSIFNSYDVKEIGNYVILNTLQNFHFRKYYIFIYQVEQNMPNLISAKYLRSIQMYYYFNLNRFLHKKKYFQN